MMTSWLTTLAVAHRGLHDGNREVSENSLQAFAAARDAGYAVELDVRLAADGAVMVMHDNTLDRLTETVGHLADFTSSQLVEHVRLKANKEPIPTLPQVLELLDGAVPLLVEVKNFSPDVGKLERAVADCLHRYRGPVAVQSFNAQVVQWFHMHAPALTRGAVTSEFTSLDLDLTDRQRFQVREAMARRLGEPQFYAHDVRFLPHEYVDMARQHDLPVLIWTVTDDTAYRKAKQYGDNVIFEFIRP
jgi:glycerophosphoryl diester phosphodiesterase